MSTFPEDYDPNEDVYNQWHIQMTMGIDEVRALYSVINYAYETWPGAPRRPYDEQEYLRMMKNRLFAMIMDYQFTEVSGAE